MEKYNTPEIRIISFDNGDIITTSTSLPEVDV